MQTHSLFVRNVYKTYLSYRYVKRSLLFKHNINETLSVCQDLKQNSVPHTVLHECICSFIIGKVSLIIT